MTTAAGIAALCSSAFWGSAGWTMIRKGRIAWTRLTDATSPWSMLRAVFDLRRVSLGKTATDHSRFRFGAQVPPPGEIDTATDAYAALTNALAAFFALLAAVLVAIAALN